MWKKKAGGGGGGGGRGTEFPCWKTRFPAWVIDGLPTVKRSYWTSSSSFLFYFPTFMYAANAYTCYLHTIWRSFWIRSIRTRTFVGMSRFVKKISSGLVHCKKELAVFPSPAGMSLIKLFLGGKNLVFSRPERVWSVTSRLETGKWLTPFNSVAMQWL